MKNNEKQYIKLSELIKPGSGTLGGSQQVGYSWHLKGNKTKEAGALAIFFNESPLRKARYRESDRLEISIGNDEIVFEFGDGLPFSVYGNKGSCNKMSKCSTKGIEVLKEMLPDNKEKTELEIISISIGKITCKLPVNQSGELFKS